jgi:hypothetical protein
MADIDIAKELNSGKRVKFPQRRGCEVPFVHLRVYLLTDKYNVEPLRKLARHRFKMEAEIVYYTAPEWLDVVDELTSAVREDDNSVREIPAVLTAAMLYGDLEFDHRMRPIMQKHGSCTLSVMKQLHLSNKLI